MLLILDDLKYKYLKFTNQRRSHSLLSIKRVERGTRLSGKVHGIFISALR